MRRLLGTMLVILIGLVAAVAIGFYPTLSSAPAADDDEQQGFDREIVIKFSHVVAENTPKGLAAQDFARRVYQKNGPARQG